MSYVIGALGGFAFGAIFGAAKYFLLWRPLNTGGQEWNQSKLVQAEIGSMFFNILCLVAVYLFCRVWPVWPYSFEATLIAAAVALSISARFSPLRLLRQQKEAQAEADAEGEAPGREKPLNLRCDSGSEQDLDNDGKEDWNERWDDGWKED